MTGGATELEIEGRVLWRGHADYETARRGALWNERKPLRSPDVIVLVTSAKDVAKAVRFARSNEMRVAIKSGGHNLSGACLREGGMLIDLSRLDGFTINVAERTATVQPAVTSRAFADALAAHGLAFPIGHCGSVPMGGYLLCGGLGWNMGQWGLACLGVAAIDVVTADGELITASERENADLFWAARGSGSGFFGVATRFHLRVHELPRAIRSSTYLYPLADVEDVSAWARDIVPALPGSVEMLLHLATAPPGAPAGPAGKAVAVTATAFAEVEKSATDALAILETCPALKRALFRQVNEPNTFAGLHDALDQRLPAGYRYIEDALWSGADYATVLPRLAEHVVRAPSQRSLVMAVMPPPLPKGAPIPDVAFSVIGKTFLLCYAIWDDRAGDDRNREWHRQLVESIERETIGRYIAEADLSLGGAARTSFAPLVWERLQALKRSWDPDNIFHGYLEESAPKEET
jgi:FAD/FMN-containing dehydrogenase